MCCSNLQLCGKFQHTAARRRLDELKGLDLVAIMFQHTAARRRLELWDSELTNLALVSTHSRPKAAGASHSSHKSMRSGFNTQPPEGGWASNRKVSDDCLWFQHTAARRRLGRLPKRLLKSTKFQHTAARRRLVDVNLRSLIGEHSFNTQPPEGGWTFSVLFEKPFSSFNTQPPEGGWLCVSSYQVLCCVSTHSRPKAAGAFGIYGSARSVLFQHTAARRRLVKHVMQVLEDALVSTHSRPKAAGLIPNQLLTSSCCFNTQPPEGGWRAHQKNRND